MSDSGLFAQHLVPNLFDPERYYQLNVRTGVMRTVFGAKCCTFSGYALKGLYLGLEHETGPAWRLILRRCGESWGKRFAARFLEEVGSFYQEDLNQMSMSRFVALIEECFAVSGWGRPRFDFTHIDAGLLLVEVQNEIMGDVLRDCNERAGALLEGVLKSLFSTATEEEMDCHETQSIGEGATTSHFVLGTRSRLVAVPTWLQDGSRHDDVMQRLLAA